MSKTLKKSIPTKGSQQKISEHKKSLLLQLIRIGFKNLGPIFPRKAAKIAFKLFATPKNKKSSRKPSAIMEDARNFTIDHKGRTIQCYAWGKNGPKVLLVHGWESKGAHLQNFVPPLLEMGYQVITHDAPAHGNSTGKMSNLVDFGETIAKVASSSGGIDHIVAHSMGSGASVYALVEPELQLKVKKLVMITSPNRLQDVFQDFYNLIHIPKVVQNYFEVDVETLIGKSVEYFQIAEQLKHAKADDYFLIHDEDDTIIPWAYGNKIAVNNPKLQMWTTKGKGHYKIIKDREVIETIVDYLES